MGQKRFEKRLLLVDPNDGGPALKKIKDERVIKLTLPPPAEATFASVPASSGTSGTSPSSPGLAIVPGYTRLIVGSKDNHDLPDLPLIFDPNLKERVFTHQGSLDDANNHRVDLSYERLEFLGDAYLECICTRIIYDRFPNLTAGRLSQIRESLVNNGTLAKYARAYGLTTMIKAPHMSSQDEKTKIKVHADVFEAYVAAVILQAPKDGFSTAEKWLSQLWAPALAKLDKNNEASGGLHGKQELAKKILGVGIELKYKDDGSSTVRAEGTAKRTQFHIGAYLTGWGYKNKRLGYGIGWSKGEAGNAAAEDALKSNASLVAQIAAKKKAFDEEVRARREREASGTKGGTK